ncbi:MAG: acetolactate synthase small subunit [Desulfobacterales bacterium]|nr:acetolactate synthase small subunit [Desulfobacterales bacterium]
MTPAPMKRRAILLFTLNRPGVLNKIAMLIRRKMYNVETITACKTRQAGMSRMTLTLREDDDAKVGQVLRQLEKMTEVVSARELHTDHSFWREVAIVKFEAEEALLESLGQRFQFEILDRQNHALYIVQVAGTSQMIDDFTDAVGNERIIETARSGFTALEK